MENDENKFLIPGIRLRWINVQTYEIQLPNGKEILFDPQFSDPVPDDDKAKYYKIPEEYGFNREMINRVDYLILNHTHCDHIIDVGYFVHKFNPIVICPQGASYELAKAFDIPFTSIYPVGNQEKHEFEDFTLYTIQGSHMPQKFVYSSMPNIVKKSYGMDGAGMDEIGHLGGLFNTNYLIHTKDNIKLAFWAGRMDHLAYPVLKQMKKYHPNILLRQIPVMIPENAADIYAKEMQELGVQFMFPMHHEMFEISTPGFIEKLYQLINEKLEKEGGCGRAFRPERGKWYQIGLGII